MDRGREFIGRPHRPGGRGGPDLDGARAWLKSYADKRGADAGSVHGIWLDGKLVGGLLFRVLGHPGGVCEAGCWLEPAAAGRGTGHARDAGAARLGLRGARHAPGGVVRLLGQRAEHQRGPAARHDPRGRAPRELPAPGVRASTEIWALLAPEWRAARAYRAQRSLRDLSDSVRTVPGMATKTTEGTETGTAAGTGARKDDETTAAVGVPEERAVDAALARRGRRGEAPRRGRGIRRRPPVTRRPPGSARAPVPSSPPRWAWSRSAAAGSAPSPPRASSSSASSGRPPPPASPRRSRRSTATPGTPPPCGRACSPWPR